MNNLIVVVQSMTMKYFVPESMNMTRLPALNELHAKYLVPELWLSSIRQFVGGNYEVKLKCQDIDGNYGNLVLNPNVVGLNDIIAVNTGTSAFGDFILDIANAGVDWSIELQGVFNPDKRTFHSTNSLEPRDDGAYPYLKFTEQKDLRINWEEAKEDVEDTNDYLWTRTKKAYEGTRSSFQIMKKTAVTAKGGTNYAMKNRGSHVGGV
jgi:hypothetical protein